MTPAKWVNLALIGLSLLMAASVRAYVRAEEGAETVHPSIPIPVVEFLMLREGLCRSAWVIIDVDGRIVITKMENIVCPMRELSLYVEAARLLPSTISRAVCLDPSSWHGQGYRLSPDHAGDERWRRGDCLAVDEMPGVFCCPK